MRCGHQGGELGGLVALVRDAGLRDHDRAVVGGRCRQVRVGVPTAGRAWEGLAVDGHRRQPAGLDTACLPKPLNAVIFQT
ncbi:MAG: hypothetical protein JO063_10650 [Pseudonocardiales bacterium]|nr:hypothetical protein [Pseudonocardiales bacterium]MBW0010557.1 hypothetical protein [Pseudonocardiales bacterium]